MRCARVRQSLGGYLEDDLGAAPRRRLTEHLEGCTRCRGELDALRRTAALVRGLPDPPPPPDLAARVMARLREDAARSRRIRRRDGPLPSPLSFSVPFSGAAAWATGVAAVAAAGGLLLAYGPGNLFGSAKPAGQGSAGSVLREAERLDLELGPRLGAGQAPEAGGEAGEALLDAWLRRLREEPATFLRDWAQVVPADRERLGARLAERARARGESAALAATLRNTGHPAAEALARRFEESRGK